MNGQWLANKEITVAYAFKKDGKGERHGSEAERLLAAQGRQRAMMQATYTGGAVPHVQSMVPGFGQAPGVPQQRSY